MEWKQREILFRGQDLHTKKWKYGYFQQTEHGAAYINSQDKGCGFEHFQVIPETVTQYTGLKDSKGQKIFEGDIVNFPDPSGGVKLLVYWDKLSGWKGRNHKKNSLWLFTSHVESMTLIGNVFENPELLGKNG